MIAPKEDFFKQFGKSWPDVVDAPAFHAGVSAALVQMALNNSSPPDMATAASFQWRMEGAKQLVSILMHLADPQNVERKLPTNQNLNHRI